MGLFKGQAHGGKRGDDGNIADSVDKEAPALTGGGDEQARQRGTDEAGGIDHRGVDGDGVGEIGAVADHLDHEGLAARHVKGIDDALHHAEGEDFANGDAVVEREPGERERLHHGKGLCPKKDFATVNAVDEDASEGREEEGGNLAGEANGAQKERGFRESIDEPRGGDAGHPGADERDALATEEEAEVAMTQGTPRVREVTGPGRGSCVGDSWRHVRDWMRQQGGRLRSYLATLKCTAVD